MITLKPQCRTCGTVVEITVSKEAYARWTGGALIQDAFPELTDGQREMLISNTCDPCWDLIMGPEED